MPTESKLEIRLSEKFDAARTLTTALHRVETILKSAYPESDGLAIDQGFLCESLVGMAPGEIDLARKQYETIWSRSGVTDEPPARQIYFTTGRLLALCRIEVQAAVNAALRAGLDLPETFRLLVWPAEDDLAVMREKLAELIPVVWAFRETLTREIETARAMRCKGRPSKTENEITAAKALLADWQTAKSTGMKRAAFCRARGISESALKAAQNLAQKTPCQDS